VRVRWQRRHACRGGPEDKERFECPGSLGRLGDGWQARYKAEGHAKGLAEGKCSLVANRFGGDVAAVALPVLA